MAKILNENSKFLGGNPSTTNIRDKNLVVVQDGGKDWIASWNVLLDNLKEDLLLPVLKTQIGKIIINMDNSKRDVEIWNDGVFEYILCDGGEINAENWSELAAIYGVNRPDFKNATIRHIPAGDTRTLGSYQADALQNLSGSAFTSSGTALFSDSDKGSGNRGTGVFHTTTDEKKTALGTSNSLPSFSWSTFDFDASRVARTADETRMKNIAVQFYVIAKVLI